jgi:hypothetical protein
VFLFLFHTNYLIKLRIFFSFSFCLTFYVPS